MNKSERKSMPPIALTLDIAGELQNKSERRTMPPISLTRDISGELQTGVIGENFMDSTGQNGLCMEMEGRNLNRAVLTPCSLVAIDNVTASESLGGLGDKSNPLIMEIEGLDQKFPSKLLSHEDLKPFETLDIGKVSSLLKKKCFEIVHNFEAQSKRSLNRTSSTTSRRGTAKPAKNTKESNNHLFWFLEEFEQQEFSILTRNVKILQDHYLGTYTKFWNFLEFIKKFINSKLHFGPPEPKKHHSAEKSPSKTKDLTNQFGESCKQAVARESDSPSHKNTGKVDYGYYSNLMAEITGDMITGKVCRMKKR